MTLYSEGALGFEVWAEDELFGRRITRCFASFYYWQECLDYKDSLVSKGIPVVIRTLLPSGQEWYGEWRQAT